MDLPEDITSLVYNQLSVKDLLALSKTDNLFRSQMDKLVFLNSLRHIHRIITKVYSFKQFYLSWRRKYESKTLEGYEKQLSGREALENNDAEAIKLVLCTHRFPVFIRFYGVIPIIKNKQLMIDLGFEKEYNECREVYEHGIINPTHNGKILHSDLINCALYGGHHSTRLIDYGVEYLRYTLLSPNIKDEDKLEMTNNINGNTIKVKPFIDKFYVYRPSGIISRMLTEGLLTESQTILAILKCNTVSVDWPIHIPSLAETFDIVSKFFDLEPYVKDLLKTSIDSWDYAAVDWLRDRYFIL